MFQLNKREGSCMIENIIIILICFTLISLINNIYRNIIKREKFFLKRLSEIENIELSKKKTREEDLTKKNTDKNEQINAEFIKKHENKILKPDRLLVQMPELNSNPLKDNEFSNFSNLENKRINKEKKDFLSFKFFKPVEPEKTENDEKLLKNYHRIKFLKSFSFQELIIKSHYFIENIKYLEATLNITDYKSMEGKNLKDRLSEILSVTMDAEQKKEITFLIKKTIEFSEHIKKDIINKKFLLEELNELMAWIKSLDENKSLKLKSIYKSLFKFEKQIILILATISKLEKQEKEIIKLKETLLKELGEEYSDLLLTSISR